MFNLNRKLADVLNKSVAQEGPLVNYNCCCHELNGCGGQLYGRPCGEDFKKSAPSRFAGCKRKRGCYNQACLDCVCSQNSHCCDRQWDGICASIANDSCANACGCPDSTPLPDPYVNPCNNRNFPHESFEDRVDMEGCMGACCFRSSGWPLFIYSCKMSSRYYCQWINDDKTIYGNVKTTWLGLGSDCSQCPS